MKHEKITLIEVRNRIHQINSHAVQGVKCAKLHYAINKTLGAAPHFKNYADLLAPLDAFARSEDDNKIVESLVGKGVSISFPKMVETLRGADLNEIAEKYQGEWDALNETVDVLTHQIPAEILPQDVDGYAYNAIAFLLAEPTQAAE